MYLAALNKRLNWKDVERDNQPDELVQVMHECLNVDLAQRPTAERVATLMRELKRELPLSASRNPTAQGNQKELDNDVP